MFKNIRAHIDENEGGMDKFTQAYKHFGLNRGEHEGKAGLWYREWAPGAQVRPPIPPAADPWLRCRQRQTPAAPCVAGGAAGTRRHSLT